VVSSGDAAAARFAAVEAKPAEGRESLAERRDAERAQFPGVRVRGIAADRHLAEIGVAELDRGVAVRAVAAEEPPRGLAVVRAQSFGCGGRRKSQSKATLAAFRCNSRRREKEFQRSVCALCVAQALSRA
jgi:hypothetical protein